MINRFASAGILLVPAAGGVWIQGNFIGTDASGPSARGNGTGIQANNGALIGQDV